MARKEGRKPAAKPQQKTNQRKQPLGDAPPPEAPGKGPKNNSGDDGGGSDQ